MSIRARFQCAVAAIVIGGQSACADLLGVQLVDVPDIASGFISVTYDAAGDQLTASGFALLFDDDGMGPAENIINGTFLLEATITDGGMSDGGTLTIMGDIPGLGVGGTLLSADLNAFGFMTGGGPLFDFLFKVTGGSLADDFYPVSSVIGMIMSGVSFPGHDFTGDFDNLLGGIPGTGSAVADIGVPAPATLALIAMAGLCGRRRRRELSPDNRPLCVRGTSNEQRQGSVGL